MGNLNYKNLQNRLKETDKLINNIKESINTDYKKEREEYKKGR